MSAFWKSSWHFCLTFCSLGCTALELDQSDPSILTNFSWAPPPSKALSQRTPWSRSLKKPKSALLKFRPVSLLFALLPPFRILNSTIPWTLQQRLPLNITSQTNSSYFVWGLAEHLSSLPTLFIWRNNLVSILSRKFLQWLYPAVLCLQQILTWL